MAKSPTINSSVKPLLFTTLPADIIGIILSKENTDNFIGCINICLTCKALQNSYTIKEKKMALIYKHCGLLLARRT